MRWVTICDGRGLGIAELGDDFGQRRIATLEDPLDLQSARIMAVAPELVALCRRLLRERDPIAVDDLRAVLERVPEPEKDDAETTD